MTTFSPKTERIKKLAAIYPKRISELKTLFTGNTHVYIDYANVFHWSNKLHWHIDIKRLKQFLDSFSNISQVNLYQGTLATQPGSINFINQAKEYKYQAVTKPVKIMHPSIDVSGIAADSTAVLKNFIKPALLKQFKLEVIEYLNNQLRELNLSGILNLVIKKCNFDVEIGRDMFLDFERNGVDTYVLWSGDSDFAQPVEQLIKDGKKVIICATVRRVSIELNQTEAPIFEINKIRDFICLPSEITPETKKRL